MLVISLALHLASGISIDVMSQPQLLRNYCTDLVLCGFSCINGLQQRTDLQANLFQILVIVSSGVVSHCRVSPLLKQGIIENVVHTNYVGSVMFSLLQVTF